MASQKIRYARQIMTEAECRDNVSPFLSMAWLQRKASRARNEAMKSKKYTGPKASLFDRVFGK